MRSFKGTEISKKLEIIRKTEKNKFQGFCKKNFKTNFLIDYILFSAANMYFYWQFEESQKLQNQFKNSVLLCCCNVTITITKAISGVNRP